jgi:hypothetical protein
MNAFRVWVHPLRSACGVRVEGIQNVQWLLNRLSQSFVFKSCEPVNDDVETACSSFQVQYSSQISGSRFQKLLAAIPEVQLMLEPA